MVNVFKVSASVLFWTLALTSSTADGGTSELLTIVFGVDRRWPANEEAGELNSANMVQDEPTPNPPSPGNAAKMARFIVHYSSWGSLSHISQQSQVAGFPVARVYSTSDGSAFASSGVPYFYMTPNDPELKDIFNDPRVSLTLTLAQTPYCRVKGFDPEDPRCAQVILTGRFVILKNTSVDWKKAQEAMFSRHPVMKRWPDNLLPHTDKKIIFHKIPGGQSPQGLLETQNRSHTQDQCDLFCESLRIPGGLFPPGHHWVFCKLEIKRILVADNFGGNKYPSVEEYFKARLDTCSPDNPLLELAFY